MSKFPYFKRLNNILSGIYNIFCVSIQPFGLLPHISHYDSAAIKMGIQISLWDPALNSFGYISRSGVTGSNRNSAFIFLKSHHTIFHSGCTILHSHQRCTFSTFLPVLIVFYTLILLIFASICLWLPDDGKWNNMDP